MTLLVLNSVLSHLTNETFTLTLLLLPYQAAAASLVPGWGDVPFLVLPSLADQSSHPAQHVLTPVDWSHSGRVSENHQPADISRCTR